MLAGCQQTPVYKNNHEQPTKKGFFDFMQVRFFGEEPWVDQSIGAHKVPVVAIDVSTLQNDDQITWLGHSTFLIQKDGINLLTDPIFSEYASPIQGMGPKRFTEVAVNLDELPDIDVVVISHNHYDHLDKQTILALGNTPMYYVPMGLKKWFVELGIDEKRVTELGWYQSATYNDTAITATPSQHWSARTLFDRNQSHWASWMIQFDNYSVWFAGDTGYNPHDFKEIGERFGSVDMGLIPIGAYAPRDFMKGHHVNPKEAVQIHQDVKAIRSIGMHWGAFPLTSEPTIEPISSLKQSVLKAQLDSEAFVSLAIGEQIKI